MKDCILLVLLLAVIIFPLSYPNHLNEGWDLFLILLIPAILITQPWRIEPHIKEKKP